MTGIAAGLSTEGRVNLAMWNGKQRCHECTEHPGFIHSGLGRAKGDPITERFLIAPLTIERRQAHADIVREVRVAVFILMLIICSAQK